MKQNHDTLLRGMIWYWFIVPTAIIAFLAAAGGAGGPASVARFMFFVYLQPLFGMTFFLAFINFGLHGFVEFGPEVPLTPSRDARCVKLPGLAFCTSFLSRSAWVMRLRA